MDIQWLTAAFVIGLEPTCATTTPPEAPELELAELVVLEPELPAPELPLAELLEPEPLALPPPHAARPRRIKDEATTEDESLRDRLSMTGAA